MADDKALEVEQPKSKKKLIIIIAIVVLLAGGGAGAYFFLMGDDAPPAESAVSVDGTAEATGDVGEDGEALPPASAEAGTAIYIPLPRPFQFNVPGAARDRFVEIRVQLLVRTGDNEENTKKHIPLLESTLLSVFSQSNADDLSTSVGKTALKQKALLEVQKVMKDVEGNPSIEKVLFTGFVMQ